MKPVVVPVALAELNLSTRKASAYAEDGGIVWIPTAREKKMITRPGDTRKVWGKTIQVSPDRIVYSWGSLAPKGHSEGYPKGGMS